MSANSEFVAEAGAPGRVRVWRGLMLGQWTAARGMVMWSLAAGLIGGWVLLLFCHPAFMIALGVLYGMCAGVLFGGTDTADGTEEFALSLPPTRSQRYLARLAPAVGTTLAFTTFGTLTIALDLPQRVWGLVVESGYTRPFPPVEHRWSYVLAVVLAMAVAAATFACASLARSRSGAILSFVPGAIVAAAIMCAGFAGEYLLWDEVNGLVSIPLLLAGAAMILLFGHAAYVRKEGIVTPAGARTGRGWTIVLIIIILVVLILVFMAFFYATMRRSPPTVRSIPTESAMPIEVLLVAPSEDGASADLVRPTTREGGLEEPASRAAEGPIVDTSPVRPPHGGGEEIAIVPSLATAVIPFFIVGIVVLAVVLLLRRLAPWPGLRRPRKRHVVTRIVCGALGVGIIVAICAGSWLQVQRPYDATGVPEQVTMPARSMETMFPGLKPGQQVELKQARLLVDFLIVDVSTPVLRTVHFDQRELQWKRSDRSSNVIADKLRIGGSEVEYSFDLSKLYVVRDEAGLVFLKVTGGGSYVYHGPDYFWSGGSGTISSGGYIGRSGLIDSFDMPTPRRGVHRALSVVPGSLMPYGGDALCMSFVTLAAEDDPLRKADLADYIAHRSTAIWSEVQGKMGRRRSLLVAVHGLTTEVPSPGAALADHIGVVAVLLVAATLLLAQLFTRRKAALVAISTALVLYVAAVDRIGLEAHLGRMESTGNSTHIRMTGCVQATTTFFWRDTARRHIAAVAADANNPAPLRKLAGALADAYTSPPGTRHYTHGASADAMADAP